MVDLIPRPVELQPGILVRKFRVGDEASLAQSANDRHLARWLTASFPHPYTLEDGRSSLNVSEWAR